jgi:hypothetical protein
MTKIISNDEFIDIANFKLKFAENNTLKPYHEVKLYLDFYRLDNGKEVYGKPSDYHYKFKDFYSEGRLLWPGIVDFNRFLNDWLKIHLSISKDYYSILSFEKNTEISL